MYREVASRILTPLLAASGMVEVILADQTPHVDSPSLSHTPGFPPLLLRPVHVSFFPF